MSSDISYLTAEGAARLRSELDELKGPARQALAQRLRAAIQMGDLSENADYHSAKEDQGFLEGRILELERVLLNAVIIEDIKQQAGIVGIGSSVTIQEDDYEPDIYQLVGPKEADPGKGRISHESPIGKAIIGHNEGDVIIVDTPNGKMGYKIIKIE
jgi:transcription elongation factor GreA